MIPFPLNEQPLTPFDRRKDENQNKSGDLDHPPLPSSDCVSGAPGNTSAGNEEDKDDDHQNVMLILINVMQMPMLINVMPITTQGRELDLDGLTWPGLRDGLPR